MSDDFDPFGLTPSEAGKLWEDLFPENEVSQYSYAEGISHVVPPALLAMRIYGNIPDDFSLKKKLASAWQ